MLAYAPVIPVAPNHSPLLVSAPALQMVVAQIVQLVNPERVILFGSYASGQPTAWSDVDLLVVMETPPDEELTQALALRQALVVHPFSLDIVVRSPATLARRIPLGDWFLKEIVTHGQVLYERSRT